MSVEITEIHSDKAEKYRDDLNLLIVFATDVERKEILANLSPFPNEVNIFKTYKDNLTYYLASSSLLANRFKMVDGWTHPLPSGDLAKYDLCSMLTGQDLIDNTDYRNSLAEQFPRFSNEIP